MWLMLNDCFLSIVSKDCARDELLVRARREGDIDKVFPEAKVTVSATTDYRYRAVVKRREVEAAMVGELHRINYGNFKDSVADAPLHNAYLRVWNTMLDLQSHGGRLFDSIDDSPRSRAARARAAAMTPERRSELARNAANARWKNPRKEKADV
jgi:hypothetical protein